MCMIKIRIVTAAKKDEHPYPCMLVVGLVKRLYRVPQSHFKLMLAIFRPLQHIHGKTVASMLAMCFP